MTIKFFEINNLKQYVGNNPGTILFARLAEDLINNGKINEAIQVCELGLKINPNYAPGYFVLSLALRKQRKKGEAAHSFSRAVENDPNYRHITLRDFQNKIFKSSKKAKPAVSKKKKTSPSIRLSYIAVDNLKIQCRYKEALALLDQISKKKDTNKERIHSEIKEIQFLQKEQKKYDRKPVLILGETKLKPHVIYDICEEFGLTKHDVEMVLQYSDIKNYNIKDLQHNKKYTGVVIGPHPQEIKVTRNLKQKLHDEDNSPNSERAKDGLGDLKLTRTTLRNALKKILGPPEKGPSKNKTLAKGKTTKTSTGSIDSLKITMRSATFSHVKILVEQNLLSEALSLLEMMKTKKNVNLNHLEKKIIEISSLLHTVNK